jgi:hypothetical protein
MLNLFGLFVSVEVKKKPFYNIGSLAANLPRLFSKAMCRLPDNVREE